MDKDYIFDIPRAHVEKLVNDVYNFSSERQSLMVQEIGEFLQALSKYQLVRNFNASAVPMTLESLEKTRDHLIEEMTHVLVCFGMLAYVEGITQEEIHAKVKEKKIDGVNYPDDEEIRKKHVSLEDLLKGLTRCETPRSTDRLNPDISCKTCVFKESDDCTIVCRPMLQEAIYYLKKVQDGNSDQS